MNLSNEQIALVVGVVLANAGTWFMAYVRLRVKIAQLEVHVDILKKSANDLGKMYRKHCQERTGEK